LIGPRTTRFDARVDLRVAPAQTEFAGTLDWDELAYALLLVGTGGLEQYWSELRALEIVIGEVAEQLDGEDPMLPETRALLEEAKAACQEVLRGDRAVVVPFEQPEADEDSVRGGEPWPPGRAAEHHHLLLEGEVLELDVQLRAHDDAAEPNGETKVIDQPRGLLRDGARRLARR
jgi:hypothetical protein